MGRVLNYFEIKSERLLIHVSQVQNLQQPLLDFLKSQKVFFFNLNYFQKSNNKNADAGFETKWAVKKKCEQWRSIFFDEGTGGALKRTKAPWREQTGGLRP